MNECIICEEVGGNQQNLSLKHCLKRHGKDTDIEIKQQSIVDVSPATLIENHATYHRICYSKYTNKSKIDRATKRYHKAVETGDTSVVKRKAVRPSLNYSNASFSEIILLHVKRREKISVAFDRYDENLLKSQTICSRINGIAPVQYRAIDITQISHLDIREFLASIHTKNELTDFLSRKFSVALTHRSYGNTTLTKSRTFART